MENNEARYWYAVYTASRSEKRVKERLDEIEIENYLPLRLTLRKWSDRTKKVLLPLLPGYIFVKVSPQEIPGVSATPGIVTFLREGGQPVPIPEAQIKALRFMNDNAEEEVIAAHENLPKGTFVRVVLGKLSGLEGELVEYQGKHRIMIRLEHLGCALTTVPISCIKPFR